MLYFGVTFLILTVAFVILLLKLNNDFRWKITFSQFVGWSTFMALVSTTALVVFVGFGLFTLAIATAFLAVVSIVAAIHWAVGGYS
jgi:uncharacterized membrane protein YfhO